MLKISLCSIHFCLFLFFRVRSEHTHSDTVVTLPGHYVLHSKQNDRNVCLQTDDVLMIPWYCQFLCRHICALKFTWVSVEINQCWLCMSTRFGWCCSQLSIETKWLCLRFIVLHELRHCASGTRNECRMDTACQINWPIQRTQYSTIEMP